ncbi:MAG TPA: transposase [Stenotrophomonas sp.]
MDTIADFVEGGRLRRRKHSPEFKAHVVAACCKPGASTAAVALANGVNANLARRWVQEAEATANDSPRVLGAEPTGATAKATGFVPVQLPPPAATPGAVIRIELQRGATKVVLTWPSSAASECAAWMRELLR